MLREAGEVFEGGSAPLVDRLVGVPDGRYREASAEHRPQQLALSWVGVLVLVEQNNAIAFP